MNTAQDVYKRPRKPFLLVLMSWLQKYGSYPSMPWIFIGNAPYFSSRLVLTVSRTRGAPHGAFPSNFLVTVFKFPPPPFPAGLSLPAVPEKMVPLS